MKISSYCFGNYEGENTSLTLKCNYIQNYMYCNKLHEVQSIYTTVWKLMNLSATQILRQINSNYQRFENIHFESLQLPKWMFLIIFKVLQLISRKNLSVGIILKSSHCVRATTFQFANNSPRRSDVKIDEVGPWFL